MKKKWNVYLTVGLILTGLMVFAALLGSFWTPYVPTAMKYGRFQAPSLAHLFGTDNFGRDIFSRVLKGTGTTLGIALSTVSIGAAFPSFLLALLIVSLVGPGKKYSVVLALGLVFIPSFARIMRTEFRALRGRNFVIGARLMGASNGRILWVHLLPNTLRALLPAFTIGFNNAVLAEASLSFLGIGVTPPDASLGYMLAEAQSMLAAGPWYALCTGLTIVLLVFGVGLLGEGLQDHAGDT